jgi:hypothetical protein
VKAVASKLTPEMASTKLDFPEGKVGGLQTLEWDIAYQRSDFQQLQSLANRGQPERYGD